MTQISWIPAKFAAIGKIVRLKDDEDWTDGWKVVDCWQTIPENEIPNHHTESKYLV